jgi:hypothetical protein
VPTGTDGTKGVEVSVVMERTYERTVRVSAPMRALYGEMDSVELIARFLSEVDRVEPFDDLEDARGRFFGTVTIGPFSYRLTGTLMIERVDPPAGLWVRLRASNLPIEFDGRFEFAEAAAEETTLRYAATIRSAHPLMRWLRSWLIAALEAHVDTATELAAVRGGQYTRAERLLSLDAYPLEAGDG